MRTRIRYSSPTPIDHARQNHIHGRKTAHSSQHPTAEKASSYSTESRGGGGGGKLRPNLDYESDDGEWTRTTLADTRIHADVLGLL